MTDLRDTIVLHSERLLSALIDPATYLQDPSKRIFWGYLIVSLLMAAILFAVRYKKRWVHAVFSQLLSPRIWIHPSSLLDMKLMVVKSMTQAFLFVSWMISSYALAVGVVHFANRQFGPATITRLTDFEITLLYTVVLFVCSDCSRYCLHRLCHQVPVLWQFHQVHHSAEVMTPLTLYRSHPVENFLFMLRGVVVTGLVTGIFFYLFNTRAVHLHKN